MNFAWSSLWQLALNAACRVGGAALRLLACVPAGLGMGVPCAHTQAVVRVVLLGLGLLGWATASLAVTAANTSIVNVATATYTVGHVPISVTGSVTVVTTSKTPATIEYMQYVGGLTGLPSGTVTEENVQPTSCNLQGSGYVTLANPQPPGRAALSVPSVQSLSDAALYASGDVVYVRVVDYDRNLNPRVNEIIDVTVTSSGGDSEQLRLTESGPSTGVFLGYIMSVSGDATQGDCRYNIGGNQKLVATYIDESEASVAITAAALVDPLGVVFDAKTGKAVNGAEVTLIDVATGLPAVVKGNDGLSTYPSTVTTGSTVVDSGGTRYVMGAGRYQFPRIQPGKYRLSVAAPVGYAFPSVTPDASIRALPNGSDYFLVTGSRGEDFVVLPGPALEIDVPLDPSDSAKITITKSAGKSAVAVGDYLPYTLSISNDSTFALAQVQITDRLPQGFRYQAGSARLGDAKLADPTVSGDGRTLLFGIGTLAAAGKASLRYVVAVLPSAPIGTAENTAQAAGGLNSNTAKASVLVRDDLNRERVILAGRVTLVESCRDDEKDPKTAAPTPIKDVRVLLEDGTYVVTDPEGRWHLDNIRPGTHVVQIDEGTMPQDFEYEACEQNTRTGGRNFSQFVNVQAGSLWRADFRYMRVASCLKQRLQVQGRVVTLDLDAPVANQNVVLTVMLPAGRKLNPETVRLDGKPFPQIEPGDGYFVARLGRHNSRWARQLRFELDAEPAADLTVMVQLQPNKRPSMRFAPLKWQAAGAAPVEQCSTISLPDAAADAAILRAEAEAAAALKQREQGRLQLVEVLPYDDRWIAAAELGTAWMHPQVGFAPALPIVKAAIKHGPLDKVEFTVNGKPVNPLRYEGQISNPAGTLALSMWRAVELNNEENVLEMTVRDTTGKVTFQERRLIHYTTNPAKALFDANRSALVADGRTPPVIAVRLLDRSDKPVRRGAVGEFNVSNPYQAWSSTDDQARDPLSGTLGGKAKYHVEEDGWAMVKLQPTTQAGEVVLTFDFGNEKKQELRVWLQPDLREWVLVGFAEGTLAHKKLSGNMENLSGAAVDRQLFDQNRLAFYAKGQVKGEYLLTAAYDTSKERGGAGAKALKQAINPTQYYTLYADATQAQYDAASIRKLYLKIEKSQFYALFGDFDTGLTVSDLGRYSRTLNGLKVEYKDADLNYNAFASQNSQSYCKNEIQGQGISGLYYLACGGVQRPSILVNSDKIRIETRDRLNPATVLSFQEYVRYIDYQIDYTSGSLFFREPIPTLDTAMNPVFIVAEYEADNKAAAKMTYGGRVGARVGEKGEVGLTHIHEGTVGQQARLTSVDYNTPLNDTTKLRAEVARSQRDGLKGVTDGGAYLVEVAQTTEAESARIYARRQDADFGLGQQPQVALGNSKVGVEATRQLSKSTQVQGTTYRETQDTDGVVASRTVVEGKVQWSEDDLSTHLGARLARESDGTGLDYQAKQLLAGASYQMLDGQLTLRGSMELGWDQAQGSSSSATTSTTSLPSRLRLGADYRLTTQTTLSTSHDIAWDGDQRVSATRVGLRTRPWVGTELYGMVGSQGGTDGSRIYADMGMVQKQQIDEHWTADYGFSRVQSQSSTGLAQSSLLSGGAANSTESVGDYTALYGGLAYREKEWSATGRLEWRLGDKDTKVNLLLAAQRSLQEGRSMAVSLDYKLVNTQDSDAVSRSLDLSLSYAYRPLDVLKQEWMWLDRLEYIQNSQTSDGSRSLTRKLINNFNANWQPDRRTQVALQYSSKYVFDTIDQAAYKGYTDLMGVEARFDLSNCWDVGLHAGLLRTWADGSQQHHLGVSTGYKVADNVWLAVGYNTLGFSDADFTGAQYRAKGFYMALRAKFDQDTFGLNPRREGVRAIQY